MQILSEESFSRIEPLLSDDYKRIRSRLSLLLKDESDIFSQVDLLPNRGKWMAESDGQIRPFKDASALEREQIAAYLEERRRSITSQLAGKIEGAADLFRVPDEDSIFWYKNHTGEVRVILSQWGFRRINQKGNADVIEFLIAMPRTLSVQEVTFRAIYADGAPVAATEFGLEIFNNTTSFKTDDAGEHFLGKVTAGQHFDVTATDGTRQGFDVTPGSDVCEMILHRSTSWTVTVVGQDNRPVVNYEITVNGETMTTDADGRISRTDVTLIGQDALQISSADGEPATFALSPEPEKNEFVYRVTLPPVEEKKEEILPPPPAAKPIRVHLLDIDGSPLDNVEVFIDQPGGTTITAMTDADGWATFPRDTFVDKKKSKLRFRLSSEYQQRRAEMKKQNQTKK